jgi:hypothetical protein
MNRNRWSEGYNVFISIRRCQTTVATAFTGNAGLPTTLLSPLVPAVESVFCLSTSHHCSGVTRCRERASSLLRCQALIRRSNVTWMKNCDSWPAWHHMVYGERSADHVGGCGTRGTERGAMLHCRGLRLERSSCGYRRLIQLRIHQQLPCLS